MKTRASRTSFTAEHVPMIRAAIERGKVDPRVRRLACSIVNEAAVPPRDAVREVKALFLWVQRNVPFRGDPAGWELLQSMEYQLRSLETGSQGGDCANLVIFLGSLLESLGHRATFIVTRLDKGRDLGHIYLRVRPRGERGTLILDPSNHHAPPGWESKAYVERLEEVVREGGARARSALRAPLERMVDGGIEGLAALRAGLSGDGAPVERPRHGAWPYLVGSAVLAFFAFRKR